MLLFQNSLPYFVCAYTERQLIVLTYNLSYLQIRKVGSLAGHSEFDFSSSIDRRGSVFIPAITEAGQISRRKVESEC